MEAQFSTIIYEAFQNAVKIVNLLQVITIFLFQMYCLLQAGEHRMSQLFYQYCASTVCLAVRAHHPRPPVCACTSCPRLTSVPRDSTPWRDVLARARSYPRWCPFLSAPMPVPAHTHSCSGWYPAHCRGQPPQTANRHIGGQ